MKVRRTDLVSSPRAEGAPEPLAPLIGGVEVPERVGQQRLCDQHGARMAARMVLCHGAGILSAKSLGLAVLERPRRLTLWPVNDLRGG